MSACIPQLLCEWLACRVHVVEECVMRVICTRRNGNEGYGVLLYMHSLAVLLKAWAGLRLYMHCQRWAAACSNVQHC
jgi:hypothetical protein